MAEYGNIDQALAGMQVGIMARIDSRIAQETIAFGAPVMGYDGVDDKCYAAHPDVCTITFNQAVVSSDIVSIVINGTTFTKTGTGANDTDMVAIKTAINASAAMIALGITAALTGSSTYRIITLTATGIDLVVVASVTPYSADGLTVSQAYSTWANFLGVALFSQ